MYSTARFYCRPPPLARVRVARVSIAALRAAGSRTLSTAFSFEPRRVFMQQTKEAVTTKKTSTPDNMHVLPLREMKDVELKIAPDFRGWTVKLSDGVNLGTVNRLFLDKTAQQLRYLEVKVDANLGMPQLADTPQLMIPVGRAQLDPKDDVVMLPTLNKTNVVNVPKPSADMPTHEFELSLAKWFGAKQAAPQLYTDEVFDLNFLVAKRPLTVTEAAKN
jgi:hypothetical protein